MTDVFKLLGSYEVDPLGSTTSFAPTIAAPINETRTLSAKHVDDVDLAADAPQALNFGGVQNAHIVLLKAVGGKVTAQITSTDGAAQAIPFDTYLVLMSESVPVTAISLTRTPGIETSVRVFLGQKA